jgi:hypothetical protein
MTTSLLRRTTNLTTVLLALASVAAGGSVAAPSPAVPHVPLTQEERAQLAHAAANAGLAPWQRTVMRTLAQQGGAPRAARASPPRGTPQAADDGTWDSLAVWTVPGSREGHTAIYDPVRRRMVVFGGVGADFFNDTWVLSLDGAPHWTQLTPAGVPPPVRAAPSAIYDPLRDRMVIFGGNDPHGYRNDVWALSLESGGMWVQLQPAGISPSSRNGHIAVYDSLGDRMIIFGGIDSTGVQRNDTWALSLRADSLAWTPLTPSGPLPAGRWACASAYDARRHRLLIFGGRTPTGLTNDTWALSLVGPLAWHALQPTGPAPSAREGSLGVYDTRRDQFVVFAGLAKYFRGKNDTWTLSLGPGSAWTELQPTGSLPNPRELTAGIYDDVRDQLVFFGGAEVSNDTWGLPLNAPVAWTQLVSPLSQPPAPRYDFAAAYDPVRHRMLIFGGNPCATSSGCFLDETWALALDGPPTWLQLTPGGYGPTARWGASAIYDPVRDRVIVFGGETGHTCGVDVCFTAMNDVYALSLADSLEWTRLWPGGPNPPARWYHAAVYDPVRYRMLVFGGRPDYGLGQPFNDVWALALGESLTWSLLQPSGVAPDPRMSMTAQYDPIRDQLLIFGGYAERDYTDYYANDVWALSMGDSFAWRQLLPPDPAPSPRRAAAMIYDPVRDRLVVYGGQLPECCPTRFANDTWALSLAGETRWIALSPSGPLPAGRGDFGGVYDALHDRFVILGGYGDAGLIFGDAWALQWDQPTAARSVTPEVQLTSTAVRLHWHISGDRAHSAQVYRHTPGDFWQFLGAADLRAGEDASYVDEAVQPGQRYEYAVALETHGAEQLEGALWVTVPANEQALRVRRTAAGDLLVDLTLDAREPAVLAVYAVTGRRIFTQAVRPSQGTQHVMLSTHDLASGLYILRLTHGTQSVITKLALLR